MAIKVKNLNGTGDNKCLCGSWLNHWDNFSNYYIGKCRYIGCKAEATDGAHVQKETGANWYIIPLCREHNLLKGQEISVQDDTTFISANVAETCAKPQS